MILRYLMPLLGLIASFNLGMWAWATKTDTAPKPIGYDWWIASAAVVMSYIVVVTRFGDKGRWPESAQTDAMTETRQDNVKE